MTAKNFIPSPKHFIQRLGVVEIKCRSILTPTRGFLQEFTHSINPYSGCWFNCSYCYVPSGFELKHGTWGKEHWGKWVHVKINAPRVLEKTLDKWNRLDQLADKIIYFGSVTDPYQLPWERRYRLTRKLLKIFIRYPVGFINIQTRSPLIIRDLDLLMELNDVLGGNIAICMTLPTNDEHVKRLFEHATPALVHRRTALKIIHDKGIETQASVAPLLPCNPELFAEQLDLICDRVVVGCLIELEDYYDFRKNQKTTPSQKKYPSIGARTREQFYEIARKHGYEWFFRPLEQSRVIHQLRKHLGKERVLQGQYGFTISAKIRKPNQNMKKSSKIRALTDFMA